MDGMGFDGICNQQLHGDSQLVSPPRKLMAGRCCFYLVGGFNLSQTHLKIFVKMEIFPK